MAAAAACAACGGGGGGAGPARSPLAGPPIGAPTPVIAGLDEPDSSEAPARAGRIEGIAGRVVVVPLTGRPWADERWIDASSVPVSYDGAAAGRARLVRAPVADVEPGPRPERSTADPSRWLGFVGRWTIAPQDRRLEPGLGVWLLVIDAPPVGTRTIRVGDRELRFTALPPTLPGWPAPWPAPPASPALQSILKAASGSPLLRFRARLARGGPAALAGGPAAPDAFAEPLLEALAQTTEARAAHALARLAKADQPLALALARRLAALVNFGAGVHAPAWPSGDRDTDALFSDLLDPDASDQTAAAKARAWLDAQPRAAVWVVDDAGATDALSDARLSTLGLANLTDRPVPAWVSSGAATPADPVKLPAWHATLLASPGDAPVPSRSGRQADAPARVRVQVDRGRFDAPIVPAPIPVTPPGLRAGPLLADWTMPAWVAGQERILAVDPSWATAALLQGGAGGWSLFVECRAAAEAPGLDVLRVWLGPRGAGERVIRVAPGESGEPGVVTGRMDRGWWAQVPIPPEAIDEFGVLLWAVERVDARGVRSTWPRPQLPWQEDPGRVAVDTRSWGPAR